MPRRTSTIFMHRFQSDFLYQNIKQVFSFNAEECVKVEQATKSFETPTFDQECPENFVSLLV